MASVTVRELGDKLDIALGGACWQSGRGTHALDVPDDTGNFDVVAQSSELRHQRNSRPGGGRHGTRSHPSSPQNHANRGQLILGLYDGESCFAVSTDSVFLHVIDEGFDKR